MLLTPLIKDVYNNYMYYLKIDTTLPIPIYKQIVQSIQKAISENVLRDGDLLPSESQFQYVFGVSNIVVKQAYKILSQEGFVQSIRGKGTFVTTRPHIYLDYEIFTSHNQQLLTQDSRLIQSTILPITVDERSLFIDNKITHVIHLKHMSFLKHDPIYLREILWPITTKKDVPKGILSLADCIELIPLDLRKNLTTELVYYPSIVVDAIATLLHLAPGDPIHFSRTDFLINDKRVGYVTHTFPAQFVTLRRHSK
jgi:DNA-binding GntR family transcriptional regulator